MKKLLLIITTICMALPAISANSIFSKYEDMKDAEVIHMNLALMNSMSGINVADVFSQLNLNSENIQDSVTIKMLAEFLKKIDEVLIIKTKNKASEKIKKDTKTLRSSYEQVFSLKEEKTNIAILYGDFGSKHECVFYMYDNDTEQNAMAIALVGDLFLQDIGKIVQTYQSSKASFTAKSSSSEAIGLGIFSVSTSKTVQFAPGNLQYNASTNTWKFADSQYDYIGIDNRLISPTYDGWIDLFGFGTGDNPSNASRDDDDYAAFVDWGINTISNGGNEANSWHTLSYSEWAYIFFSRRDADGLWSFGEINGVGGIVLLPDNWSDKNNKMHFLNWRDFKKLSSSEREKNEWANSYNKDTWAKMEALGAVFIPCCGYRNGTSVYAGGGAGNYFTCTPDEENTAYALGFNSGGFTIRPHKRNSGHGVRLVRECK